MPFKIFWYEAIEVCGSYYGAITIDQLADLDMDLYNEFMNSELAAIRKEKAKNGK